MDSTDEMTVEPDRGDVTVAESGVADTSGVGTTVTTPTVPHPRRRIPGLPKAPALPKGPAAWTAGFIALSVLAFAALAYQRRWIADDGMIAVRTAQQIVAGNGPVYSPFERAETNTSTLWTYLIAAGGWLSGMDMARVAVFGGLLCSVLAAVFALDGTRRFHLRFVPGASASTGKAAGTGKTPAASRVLIPAGFLVVLGISPFWDYATSGLESGLGFLWIGACWWLLVAWCASGPSTARLYTAAVVFGSAPLIRPEFTLIGAVFAVVTWLLVRPGVRRTLGLAAAAAALPVVYEIFRAGYYGLLVPLPALTKSASGSRWGRGFDYAEEFAVGYAVYIPLILFAITLAIYAKQRIKLRAERLLLAAPLTAGLLLGLYVLRVGGDFMHARMMLPVTFLLLLPVMLLPLTKTTAAVVAAAAVWATASGTRLSVTYLGEDHAIAEDEHSGYQYYTGMTNPDASKAYFQREIALAQFLTAQRAAGHKVLTSEGGILVPLDPSLGIDAAVAAGRLGTVGAVTPLDELVVDTLGLSNPIGARITATQPGRPGHEKVLPWAWIFAAYGDPAAVDDKVVMPGVDPADVRAARHAMQCGALKELDDSTRQPMSMSRFWNNLTGSLSRTTLVIPADPVAAEKKFCG